MYLKERNLRGDFTDKRWPADELYSIPRTEQRKLAALAAGGIEVSLEGELSY